MNSLDRKALVSGLARACGTAAGLVALYFLMPLERATEAEGMVWLVVGLVLLVLLIWLQLRLIASSSAPGLRAVETLATITPLYLVLFATSYFLMSRADPAAFSERLDRAAALYYTVTVFSSVGFGDIAARTGAGRMVTTAQMMLNLILLGVGLKLIIGAVRIGARRRDQSPSS